MIAASSNSVRRWVASRFSKYTEPHLLSPEEFQQELAVLGLSGERFTPTTYAAKLGSQLDLTIELHVLADQHYPRFSRQLARSGTISELIYSDDAMTATILLPSTLPSLLLTLTAYHELGHLAAGHHLPAYAGFTTISPTPRLHNRRPAKVFARRSPDSSEELQEQEADLRASYALLAGSLGPDSPYAQEMYDIL